MQIKQHLNPGMQKRLLWLWIFAIAMGLLEAAVVIYLRELYYPGGTSLFPMKHMPTRIAVVELFRELATIVMLAAAGYLCARNAWSRFGAFLVAFAVWDLFYYLFLYLFISWPTSLLQWDILFLIPVPWFGPVITPCVIAVIMIVLGTIMIQNEEKETALRPRTKESLLLLTGTLTCLISFTWHFITWLFDNGEQQYHIAVPTHVPDSFPWLIYGPGIALMICGVLFYRNRVRLANKVIF